MKLVSLSGILGYGYEEESLQRILKEDINFIGVDGGSSDPGPNFLGQGKSFVERDAVKRDVRLILPEAIKRGIPFIVGTAGGAGGTPHLLRAQEIFEEVARENNLSFKLALINTEISKKYLQNKLKKGRIESLSDDFNLTEQDITESTRRVSQIGIKPYLEALKQGADVVLAGRSCDTAIFAAIPLKEGYAPGLVYHMAKIMECGAMCSKPLSASDMMMAQLEEDYFILEPPNPERKCTVERVAAHTLYEQENPYYIYELEGVVDLREAHYQQLTERSVKVSNSKFEESKQRTIKIEGVKLAGYRTISIGGIREEAMINKLKEILYQIKVKVQKKVNYKRETDFYLHFRKYDINGVQGKIEQCKDVPHEVGIVIEVVGKTQEIANEVCATARAHLLHFDYTGRKTTAGNIAFPYSPSDIAVGPVYNFNICHLVEVDDLCETAKIEYVEVGG